MRLERSNVRFDELPPLHEAAPNEVAPNLEEIAQADREAVESEQAAGVELPFDLAEQLGHVTRERMVARHAGASKEKIDALTSRIDKLQRALALAEIPVPVYRVEQNEPRGS